MQTIWADDRGAEAGGAVKSAPVRGGGEPGIPQRNMTTADGLGASPRENRPICTPTGEVYVIPSKLPRNRPLVSPLKFRGTTLGVGRTSGFAPGRITSLLRDSRSNSPLRLTTKDDFLESAIGQQYGLGPSVEG